MSDTPRTDVAQHNVGSVVEPHYVVDIAFARQLERELAEAQAEITRLKGEAESWEKVFDRTCEHLAEAKEELNDKRKFCYAVEQALDKLKGDYVEIIKELRKDAKRYWWLRKGGIDHLLHGRLQELDDNIDAAMKEGGK